MRDLTGLPVNFDYIRISPLDVIRAQPQDAYHSSPSYTRLLDRHVKRPNAGDTTVQDIVHTRFGLPTSADLDMEMPLHEQVTLEEPNTV